MAPHHREAIAHAFIGAYRGSPTPAKPGRQLLGQVGTAPSFLLPQHILFVHRAARQGVGI
jgi:hypothetical protein